MGNLYSTGNVVIEACLEFMRGWNSMTDDLEAQYKEDREVGMRALLSPEQYERVDDDDSYDDDDEEWASASSTCTADDFDHTSSYFANLLATVPKQELVRVFQSRGINWSIKRSNDDQPVMCVEGLSGVLRKCSTGECQRMVWQSPEEIERSGLGATELLCERCSHQKLLENYGEVF